MKIKNRILSLLQLAVLILCAKGSFAAVLQLDINGQLLGAQGVMIDDVSYDAEFLSGTCAEIFSGCEDHAEFANFDHDTARKAGHALLEQVFIDGIQGNFDTDGSLTNGCTRPFCVVFSPYTYSDVSVFFSITQNLVDNDSVSLGSTSRKVHDVYGEYDSSNIPFETWARWTTSSASTPSQVNAPNVLVLLILGLLTMSKARYFANRA